MMILKKILRNSAIIHKNENETGGKAVQAVPTRDIQQIYPYEEKFEKKLCRGLQAKREVNGLTFTQNVGVFPRQVALEIRHRHATLGLNDVAHQRRHTESGT